MRRIKCWVATSMTGSAVHSEVEVDDDASDDDIDNAVYDQMAQYCDYGWEEVES